jgi:hypothetical protein
MDVVYDYQEISTRQVARELQLNRCVNAWRMWKPSMKTKYYLNPESDNSFADSRRHTKYVLFL